MSEWKTESRKSWNRDPHPATMDDLKIGCLQRIADATEAMAQEHTRLIRDRDYYEKYYRERGAEIQRLVRRVNSLRGVITRMKRKAATP